MATICLAMWLQDSDLAGTNHLIMIFIGLVAVAMAVMAIALIIVAVVASKAVKTVTATIEELKGKMLPVFDVVKDLGQSGREIVRDATPKVKRITENLVTTSESLMEAGKVARGAVQHIDATISEANSRTQRQVARVDGMVTTALDTSAEIVETINHGIRVPAHKIAVMATDARFFVEGLLAKVKSMVANTPFASQKQTYKP